MSSEQTRMRLTDSCSGWSTMFLGSYYMYQCPIQKKGMSLRFPVYRLDIFILIRKVELYFI